MSGKSRRGFLPLRRVGAAAFGAASPPLQAAPLPGEALVVVPAALFLFCMLLFALVRLLGLWLWPLFLRMDAWRLHLLAFLAPRRGLAPRVLRRLLDRDAAELAALGAAAAVFTVCALGLIELTGEMLEQDELQRLDLRVFESLQTLRSDAVDRAMVGVTELGGAHVTLPLLLVVGAWLALRRRWETLAYWLAAILAARASVVALKWALARERPGTLYEGVDAYSFPSGHATSSLVVYGFLAFLLSRWRGARTQAAVLSAAAAFVGLIGLSRLYLGAHWLSDVVAGYALALAWLVLLGTAYLRFHPAVRLPTAALALVAGLALIAAAALQYGLHFDETLERYRALRALPKEQAGADDEARIEGRRHRVLLIQRGATS